MVNAEVVRYISSNLGRGMPYDQVYQNLLMSGYSDFEIKQARDFVLSGKKIERSVDPNRKYTPNQFLLILGIVGFIAFMFIIFGILFSNVGEKQVTVSGDSFVNGVEILMTKSTRLLIEDFRGEDYNFSVKYKSRIFTFNDGDIVFSLLPTEEGSVDLDKDGNVDLVFAYLDEESLIVEITEVCEESWSCSEWGECIFGKKQRVCIEENSCGSEYNRPDVEVECISSGSLPSSDPVKYTAEIVTEESYTYFVPNNSTNETNLSN
jgi:hypothetical protein